MRSRHWLGELIIAVILAALVGPFMTHGSAVEQAFACTGNQAVCVGGKLWQASAGGGTITAYKDFCTQTWAKGYATNNNWNAYLTACDWGSIPNWNCTGAQWEFFPGGSVWSSGSVYCVGCTWVQSIDNNVSANPGFF